MIIDVPFSTLKKLGHVADLHIRLVKRHDEYREVLALLYDQLRSADLSEGAIVVAGDIVHAKTDMSPEMVEMASEFLKNLADIAPTIVIAGNHDLNLSNMSRLDSLSPIIKSLNHPNLHYFKHSGIYQVADTDFVVYSILDDREEWPSVADARPNAKKIGLYHGPVHGAQTDSNYVISNRHTEVSLFDGLDAVLLGDIHKYQVLQLRHNNKPVVAYASSLIQQNHGESLTGHGWCLWDLTNDFKHKFMPVYNNFGYYTLELDGENVVLPTDMPKNVRLRLFTGTADASAVKKIVAVLRKQYNIIELSLNKSRNNTVVVPAQPNVTVTDINNVDTQNTLIQDWIERHYENVDDDLMKKILDVSSKMNAQVNHEDQSRNIHWRPVKFTFSNMFSYGENEINFGDMKGVYGVFAPNASGKSSSMDALIFCLYDKTPRAFKGDHIMNNRCDKFSCELYFEINEDKYFIRRTGARKKNGDVKVDVLFWKENEDGTHLSMNGEDRRDTNANIRNYVGSYEDFVLTTLSSQFGNSLFIDKSHSDRKDLLIQFMGLNVFDMLCDTANEYSKEVSGALKKFQKTDFTQLLSDTQITLEADRIKNKEVEGLLEEAKQERDDIYTRLKEWQEKKLSVPVGESNIHKLVASLNTTKARYTDLIQNKEELVQRRDEYAEQLSDQLIALGQYDVSKITADAEEYDTTKIQIQKLDAAIRDIDKEVEQKEYFRATLENYKFDSECEFCLVNGHTHIEELKTTNERLTELWSQRTRNSTAQEAAQKLLASLLSNKHMSDELSKMQMTIASLKDKVSRQELEMEVVVGRIDISLNQQQQTQKEIDLYYTNEENIKFNESIQVHITHLEYDVSVNRKVIDRLEKELRELHGKIKVLETTKTDLMKQITEAEELEDTYEAYKYYMAAVGRDGVPNEMMLKAIPTIEAEINSILTQIVEFTISLEIDGKNIMGKLNYDHERIWPLENSSGMERFISSLAIRVALINVSNLPKPNFLIIDEGLGVLDAENLGGMSTLFSILKNQFDFVVVISHLEAARDMVDKLLTIKREDGFSYINA